MNAHKKNELVAAIRTYTPPINTLLVTVFLFMCKYEFVKIEDRLSSIEQIVGISVRNEALDSQKISTIATTQSVIIQNRSSDFGIIEDTKQRVDVLYAILPTHK